VSEDFFCPLCGYAILPERIYPKMRPRQGLPTRKFFDTQPEKIGIDSCGVGLTACKVADKSRGEPMVSLSDFTNILDNYWSVIRNNLKEFIIVFALGICVGFFIGYMGYTGTIEALKVSNDGITKALNEQIEGLNDILKGKDELLNEYRQRLGILPPPDNPYFRLTHEELKKEVLKFVSELRSFANRLNSENYPKFFQMSSELGSANTPEEKGKVYNKYGQLLHQKLLKDHADFNSRFQSKAIIFRDVMISRLPKEITEPRDTFIDLAYVGQSNAWTMLEIADDLERMTNRLQ
jgi:hypothetical protein